MVGNSQTFFMNPFHKHDLSEFEGVYQPLEQSRRKSSIVSGGMPKKSLDGKEMEDGDVAEPQYAPNTLESLRAEIDADIATSGHDSVYDRKSKVINKAIGDIGMGRYQWELFVLCGFGWFADNLWLQGVALTLPSLTPEFGVSESLVRYTTCSLFIGLCIGASFWGVASDVIGRRPAFNLTLFIAGVFGLAVGGASNWIGVCGMFAALGVGVGGNLPVDGALFLEFLPFASGNLLTMLSVWWPVGQLVASLIGWGFLAQYSCTIDQVPCGADNAPGCCASSANKGWRYFTITLGALTFFMFICRFFVFHLFESPKFLLSKGRQTEAVASVYGIARKNRTMTWLNEEILNEIGGQSALDDHGGLSFKEIVQRQMEKFSTQRIGPLFADRKLGTMTALLWFSWATIGMGYPLFNAFLPQYLQNSGKGQAPTPQNIVYRNYVITSVVGVPGSLIACYTVDIKYIGRKGTIAFATVVTGILLFCFTISSDPSVQVAMTSLEAFFQNIMYGVLYAYTPEVFPAPNRGTGTGIASFFNRIAGLCAPIVAANSSGVNPNAPVYASGGLMLAAFVSMLFYPIETRGKQKL